MTGIRQEEFKIKTYEVDSKNRLKITQLFNFMQEAAGNHAYELGCGYDDLMKDNRIWVLSKLKVHLNSYPGCGETIGIETWPKGAFRLYAARDFLFKNAAGEALGGATSIWLLLDVNTRRPQKVETLKFNYHQHQDRHGMDEMLEKLRPSGGLEKSFERVVSYNDLDVNNHVNNARYVDWIMDCFSAGFLAERQINALQVNYLSEAKPDDSILIHKFSDIENPASFFLEGVNKLTGNNVFQAKIEFPG